MLSHWNIHKGHISFVSSKSLVSVCSLSPSRHMLSCCPACESLPNNRPRTERPLSPPRVSHLMWGFFCVHQIFCLNNNYIAATIFASQSNLNVNPRRMWTASKFLFECMWILVLRSPTARRNNANAALSNLFSVCMSTWASAHVT